MPCFHLLKENNNCQNHELGVLQFQNIFVGGFGGQILHQNPFQWLKVKCPNVVKTKITFLGLKDNFKFNLCAFTFAHSELEDPVYRP